ncbi:MAG: hypothetical protein KDB80_03380 [Planctomycetes bacterium]|nr:hypothetical protein [Planctomycetota bacterium]
MRRESLLVRGQSVACVSFLAIVVAACSGGSTPTGSILDGPAGEQSPNNSGDAELVSVSYGRLVDVYGLSGADDENVLTLYRSDVVIGLEIADQRESGSDLSDAEVSYDFLANDPLTLSSRLLIPRRIGSEEFDRLFDELDDRLRNVTAAKFGQDVTTRPFSVVPRNAAFVLEFSQALELTDEFFVAKDDNGVVQARRNTEAVQLLRIDSDPNDAEHVGDFRPIATRIIVRGNKIVLDPVFLGVEGTRYGTQNNAAGLPASLDQYQANLRLAIALEGPLAMPGVHIGDDAVFRGRNNDGFDSIIRDFRSGNPLDESVTMARGFLRDLEPPRLVGSIPFRLRAVETTSADVQTLTIYKAGRRHGIDRGDILRIIDPKTGSPIDTEVVDEPTEDAEDPGVQHVLVPVRRVDALNQLDPRSRPDFPSDPESPAGENYLRREAPVAVLIAEFTLQRRDSDSLQIVPVDDPANFVIFSPTPFAQVAGYDPFPGEPSPPNANISPFASVVVQFSKPIDFETVKPLDTMFFATREVIGADAELAFRDDYQLTANQFNAHKFVTPHLVHARAFDEDGSQASVRLQPAMGFYLDEDMRRDPMESLADEYPEIGEFATTRYPYFLHIVGGLQGVRDLAGNPLDFQSVTGEEHLTVPFFLDGRKREDFSATPFFEDNLAVSIVRRFANADEDEQPSQFRASENDEYEFPMPDVFGSVSISADGKLSSRPFTRITKVVDDINQPPVPDQASLLRHCPLNMVADQTAGRPFGAGIQNPLNPYGCRLQTVWREIDFGLSRQDPFDFNLDVERLYWAPLTTEAVYYDIFDAVSLFLGHSEFRPEPCTVGGFSQLTDSGLIRRFADNYARNKLPEGSGQTIEYQPAPHPAYVDRQLTINPAEAVLEPNGINRFLPLPKFDAPYFVWRDETESVQGGSTNYGMDTVSQGAAYDPYILSPFRNGRIRPQRRADSGAVVRNESFWDNRGNVLQPGAASDAFTDGLLGSIALPLLADFQSACDSPDLPEEFGFVANGFNGWQISLTVVAWPQPNFRSFSGGIPAICVNENNDRWVMAAGQPAGGGIGMTPWGDNSLYWTMADFLKRQSVATSGFVDIVDPHRKPTEDDPRLGPFFGGNGMPNGYTLAFDWNIEPSEQPGGASVFAEFRGASRVVEREILGEAWPPYALGNSARMNGRPNEAFALNPYVAGDAHIKKYDRRLMFGTSRHYWSHFYNEHVTDYTDEVEDLVDPEFLDRFHGNSAGDDFEVHDLRYFNWRFVMSSTPVVAPAIDSFAISYRFERSPN